MAGVESGKSIIMSKISEVLSICISETGWEMTTNMFTSDCTESLPHENRSESQRWRALSSHLLL